MAKAPLPSQRCEKLVRTKFIRQFVIAFKLMNYFMQTSSNITGRKHGAIVWTTSEKSMFRTRPPEQLERYASLSVRPETNGESTKKNPSRLPSNYTSYRQHEQRKSDIWTQNSSTGFLALSKLEMVLRSKPNLRLKFHALASPKVSTSACFGKPRSIHQWWSVASNLVVVNVLVGGIKMEVERWSVKTFFCLRISHPRSGNCCVCDGRHVHAWLDVFAMRMSYLSISPSPFWCFIRHPCCSRTVTSRPPSCLHRLFFWHVDTLRQGGQCSTTVTRKLEKSKRSSGWRQKRLNQS